MEGCVQTMLLIWIHFPLFHHNCNILRYVGKNCCPSGSIFWELHHNRNEKHLFLSCRVFGLILKRVSLVLLQTLYAHHALRHDLVLLQQFVHRGFQSPCLLCFLPKSNRRRTFLPPFPSAGGRCIMLVAEGTPMSNRHNNDVFSRT